MSQRLDGAAIDMPAGPSEVLVIADSGATPDFVASDLLSRAERPGLSGDFTDARC